MSLELILGPMFSGKSSAILARLRRAEVLGIPTLVLTSALDKRYTESAEVVTHNLQRMDAISLMQLMDMIDSDIYKNAKMIVIEEAQFFTDLKEFVLRAVDIDLKNVVVVGLDGDSRRQAFGQIPELLPHADKIEKLTALCARCGDWTPAIFTHRKTTFETQVAVGDTSMYEPLCRRHWRELNQETVCPPRPLLQVIPRCRKCRTDLDVSLIQDDPAVYMCKTCVELCHLCWKVPAERDGACEQCIYELDHC